MNVTTPLRYPGGKGRLSDFIKLVFERNGFLDGHYVEPYAGGAGIALNLLTLHYASCVHLNDIDPSVFAFWHSVINSPNALCKLIRDAKLNVKEWKRQRAIQRAPEDHDLLELGFSLFYLNRTNRSGIITGGVIGGNDQAGEWKIDARFNKKELSRRVEMIALYRSRIRLYNLDAATFIKGVLPSLPEKTLVYLDPPYYSKADRLYKNFYKHADHVAVAQLIKKQVKVPWIVSYDYMPEVAAMYKDFPKIVYGMTYSAAECYKGREVMFFSKRIIIPDVENPAALRAA